MKKSFHRLSSVTLATSLLLGAVPYSVFASSTVTDLDQLSKVNELTKVVAELESSAAAKIAPSLDTTSDKVISVIIEFKQQPVAVAKAVAISKRASFSPSEVEAVIGKEQVTFERAAKKQKLNLEVGHTYNQVFNGMEVSLPANQIEKMASLPGVKAVYSNAQYTVPETEVAGDLPGGNYDLAPIKQIGVDKMWAEGFTGKGLKVGVIDTGVDYHHPDLKDAFKGGYDSFDNDHDPYERPPVPADEDVEKTGDEGSNHGTHVSGTIVGRASAKTDVNVRGIAYEADLYVYRVLGRGGGSSAQVIDGIEKAVRDGMDVINLSLGSDIEKNGDSPDSIAVNNAVLAGVVTVIANGNAAQNEKGRHFYTAGSPAGAKLPIAVGAVTSPSTLYDGSAKSSFGSNYDFHVMGYETNKTDFKTILGTEPLQVVYANLGSELDFKGKDLKGKVALVSRGTLAFTEKIANAKKAGAKAIVVFNGNDANGDMQADLNNPGREGHINSILGDSLDTIPTFDMKGAEGWALAKQLLADPAKAQTLTFTFGANYPKTDDNGDKMAGFSSRGPIIDGQYSIKPDISAPGVSVLSAKPEWLKYFPDANYDKAYQRLNGTSMATPHVAGLSLLLKQAHPDWTPFDIKAALANTSVSISDAKGTQYDVYSQGAGRVDGYAALKTPALLQTVEKLTLLDTDLSKREVTNYGDNVSFGLMEAGDRAVEKTLQLKNTGKKEVSYTAEIVMHDSVTTDPYEPVATPDVDDIAVSLTTDEVVAKAGKTTKFGLKLSPTAQAKDGVYEGEVLLKSNDGNPDLHLPFVVHVGDEREQTHFGLDEFSLSSDVVSPNGDGVNDTVEASVLLQADDTNVIELQAWGYNDRYIGTLASIVDEDGLAPGTITFTNIDGSYVSSANGSYYPTQLEDGNYKLRIVAYNTETGAFYEMWKALGVSNKKSTKADAAKLKELVDAAKQSFKAEVTNTTVVGEPVLTLPADTAAISYKVTNSSNVALVGKEGKLQSLPNGKEDVYLYVTIAAVADSSIKRTVKVKVTLQP
ncbi:S8 family serine peptidase [Brevibacillus dissolubilis]|uniref:S8 family serine peptidase n=1 Tax=Brevibacillus dissolubilis TaxID=1844116 RepID=UPI0021004024|nr:S8 family serine peptidase [Brevibacillus dissolubilis]